MPSPAFRDSSEIVTPLFEYLSNPDESVSIGMLRRQAERLPHDYQREVARGILSLIDGDRASARVHFDEAERCSPSNQYAFVLSNAGVSFNAANCYADELDYIKRSVRYRSPHLLRYAYFVSARWCDFELFTDVAAAVKKLNVQLFTVDEPELLRMMNYANDTLSILSGASPQDQQGLNFAAKLIHELAEQESLGTDNTTVWIDDEGSYCYALHLDEKDYPRYQDLDQKLDRMVIDSGLNYVRVTPLILFGA